MRVLNELLANRVLWVAISGWFVAQALKVSRTTTNAAPIRLRWLPLDPDSVIHHWLVAQTFTQSTSIVEFILLGLACLNSNSEVRLLITRK